MAITEPTTTVRVRLSDERAVKAAAIEHGWTGPFPELLSRFIEMLRRRSDPDQPKQARAAKRATTAA